jgi:hypothetical protein
MHAGIGSVPRGFLLASNLDTNHDGLLGKGDTSVSFTQDGDLVLNMAAYGAGATPDTVTLKGVAFLHSTDVAVT